MADDIIYGEGRERTTLGKKPNSVTTPTQPTQPTKPSAEEQAIIDKRNKGDEIKKENRITKKWATTENDLASQILGIWKENGILNDGFAPKRGKMSASEVKASARLAAVNMISMGGKSKELYGEYIKSMEQPVMPLVIDLLGDMIQRVPLNSMDDIKQCGFFSERAYKGTHKDIWVLKAVCGWKQSGQDMDKMWGGGNLKDADEITALIKGFVDNEKRDGRWENNKIFGDEQGKRIKQFLEMATQKGSKNVIELDRGANAMLAYLGIQPDSKAEKILNGGYLSYATMVRMITQEGIDKYVKKVYDLVNAVERSDMMSQNTALRKEDLQIQRREERGGK